ncbi:MAG: class I SAM-dependent methyltransferase [Betaproteobacteria bacterium HGW-Betaproteobacteria-22]|nr:MAG: class I SAM-dependent methyltransferase [Betaproteobacteria bacterium HGW-Betaproteobacteria-22]
MQHRLSNFIYLKPATLSLLIQSGVLLALLALFYLIQEATHHYSGRYIQIPVLIFVLFQSFFTLVLVCALRMPTWWRWIHFCFPIAIFLMFYLSIPSEIYLAGFLVTLSLYWSTYRTQVPFYPSTAVVRQAVTDLLPKDRPIRMIDIGSGLGDMSMYLAKLRPESRIEGIELAPLPWLISVVRAKFKRSRAVFTRGDYHALNFADYDVVFAYLSPAAMPALWHKAKAEMRKHTLLVSYEFEITGSTPTDVIDLYGTKNKLYVWKMAQEN